MAFPGTIAVTSPDLEHRTRLADRFTADHENDVPRIHVSGVPTEAVELALVCHDPDAPIPFGFTHWSLFGIPADSESISAESGREGPNSTGGCAYYGPQPPHGHGGHSYYFWVYALSRPVDGEPTREEFLRDYAGDILEQNRLIGYYSR